MARGSLQNYGPMSKTYTANEWLHVALSLDLTVGVLHSYRHTSSFFLPIFFLSLYLSLSLYLPHTHTQTRKSTYSIKPIVRFFLYLENVPLHHFFKHVPWSCKKYKSSLSRNNLNYISVLVFSIVLLNKKLFLQFHLGHCWYLKTLIKPSKIKCRAEPLFDSPANATLGHLALKNIEGN